MPDSVLDLEGVTVAYARPGKLWRKQPPFLALDDVTFSVRKGEVFGVVGESGSGKTTLARCIAGLQRPTSGMVRLLGEPLEAGRRRDPRHVQMVFQDPYASLNPRMSVGAVLTELIRIHHLAPRGEERKLASDTLALVGIPERALDLRPRQFSGGQRQRIAIARALVLRPLVLLADEPVSSLDVSVQASILLLLRDLQRKLGLTVLFISHDLAVVHQFCDRAAVMCDGRVVEVADIKTLFEQPEHPYTRQLLHAAIDLPTLEVPTYMAGQDCT